MEEKIIFNLKNFKTKVLPTLTVCGSALFMVHGKAAADQIKPSNQNQPVTQAAPATAATGNANHQNNITLGAPSQTDQAVNQPAPAAPATAPAPQVPVQQPAARFVAITPQASQSQPATQPQAGNQAANHQAQTNNAQVNQVNAGWLDNVKLTDNGNLQVSGWHVADQAANTDKDHHFVIAYDNTTKQELGRVQVTNPVARPDVAKAYQTSPQANQSGFNVDLKLSPAALANADSITIISRYAASQDGNSDYVDYWYAPVTFDKENHAWLDSVTIKGDQLQVSGWNATNQAANKPYHTIMVYDRTAGQVVAYQQVTNQTRVDVANAYPKVNGADQSGFTASFNLNNLDLSHQLQIISRYSSQANGRGQVVDYNFTPITTGDNANTNQGYLDNFDISNGQTLKVSGWHADDLSSLENNHFVIIFDNTTNQQVAAVKVNTTSRSDVAKAYPTIATAGQSGFSASFDQNQLNLQANHTYSVVSRYSTSATGNGGDGQYTDHWFKAATFNQQASWIDSIHMNNNGALSVSGWMASDYAKTRPNAWIIVLADGREVGRQQVALTNRPDVANANRSILNSAKSGFNTTVNLNNLANVSGNLQVIMRFAGANPDKDYADQYSRTYATNAGNFDQIQVSDNGIYVSGWHASDASANKPYQYLIFVDAKTGQEIYRQRVLDINRSRQDVANVNPYILNAGQSGFQLGFNIPSQLDHHQVKIIDRLTDDVNGNGNYVDMISGVVNIHEDNRWAWPFPAVGEGHFAGAQRFGVNPGGEFRINGFHDGLDFGSIDHPGTQVHAVHGGTVSQIGYTAGLDWYVVVDTGDYLVVYQEAFANRNDIKVQPGQRIEVGDVVGNRDTAHVHIGITKQKNFNIALANSFNNNGTWLNPEEVIRNGLNG